MNTAPTLDPWPHYPRPGLAKTILTRATVLGMRAFTMFAPRGLGKTEFIRRDLIPEALSQGFRCVYVDVWLVPSDPLTSIVRQLAGDAPTSIEGSNPRSTLGHLARSAADFFSDAHLTLKVAGVELGIGAKGGKSAPTGGSAEEVLIDAFQTLLKLDDRPILLILDEIQTLATAKFEPLVGTLRSILQAQDARIVRLFTGSSRNGLDRLFRRNRKAAFFQQGGHEIELPPLGVPFIQTIAEWVDRSSGLVLDVDEATAVLHALGYSARLFREAVYLFWTRQATTLTEAGMQIELAEFDHPDLVNKIASLKALERALLYYIANQGTQPYSESSRSLFSEQIGKPVSKNDIQRGLRHLETLETIYRTDSGEYAIESVEVGLYLESLERG